MLERFLKKISPEPNSGCWLWTACVDECGYGMFRTDKTPMKRAHRISYSLFCSNIPEDLNVLHECDNPCCVNPNHLRLGTHSDNMKDRSKKNRAPHLRRVGSSNGAAKLSEEQVKVIKNKIINGSSDIELSKEFKVDRKNIYYIRTNKIWKHV